MIEPIRVRRAGDGGSEGGAVLKQGGSRIYVPAHAIARVAADLQRIADDNAAATRRVAYQSETKPDKGGLFK